MMHIRIGVQTVSSSQLECVARLSREYSNGIVHVATSQGLQIDDVKIESVPYVFEQFVEAGLSSHDGAGDAVRNVTACARAGLCPREQFNVAPYALAVAAYVRPFDSSYGLSGKHKIAFSGCPSDCALAAVADLGFFAQLREGARGFSVQVGGGLGPPPVAGVQVEAFVRDDDVLAVAEAIKRLFDKYTDRDNEQKATLRGVVERLGADEFIRCYQEQRAKIRAEGLACDVLQVAGPMQCAEDEPLEGVAQDSPASEVLPETRDGFYTLRVRLPRGDISADDLVKVAQISHRHGAGTVRVTQQQNLLVPSVSEAHLGAARDALQSLDSSA